MLGGIIEFCLLKYNLPLGVSLLISSLSVAVIAALIHKIFISQTKNATELSLIIMTVGISITIKGSVMLLADKDAHPVDSFLPIAHISVFGAIFASQYLIVILFTFLIIFLLYLFFKKTLFGKIMQASSMNPLAARLFGVDVNMVQMLSFAISGFIGALAGAIIAPISFAQYDSGVLLGLKGFAASVVGGFGNNNGALIGGLIIGVAESLSAGYISSSYKDLAAFLIMLIVLFIRPQGLFSSKDVERV